MTRARLLAAAERVIDCHRYGGASIDLITAEAGYSKGAIYSNFKSKEAFTGSSSPTKAFLAQHR